MFYLEILPLKSLANLPHFLLAPTILSFYILFFSSDEQADRHGLPDKTGSEPTEPWMKITYFCVGFCKGNLNLINIYFFSYYLESIYDPRASYDEGFEDLFSA